MEIKKVGVLGCGLMGSGIAQVCATGWIRRHCARSRAEVSRQGLCRDREISGEVCRTAGREGRHHGPAERCDPRAPEGHDQQADLADCDIVIEAIIENVEEKKKMYAALDGIVKKDAIFASNTSSISDHRAVDCDQSAPSGSSDCTFSIPCR